jgi:CelD/BcsL family acetyltransferase involved in cellulose biosynthesis
MKVDLITRREDLRGLADSWNRLAQSEPRDAFFRSFRCYMAWLENIRPDAEPFVLIVRDAGGALVGLAPLCRGIYRDLGVRLKAIFWAGREVVSGDFLDFLCAPNCRPQVIQAMVDYLGRNRSYWDLLVLGELVDGADSYLALERMAKQYGLPFRRQEERTCPYIPLPGSFDDFLGSLGNSTRYHIRRRMRDVEKAGGRVEVFSRPGEVAAGLDVLIRLHLARWRKDNLPGTMGHPGLGTFLRQVCSAAESSSRLYRLVHEGEPVAALLTFHSGESALYYQAGWNPESRLSSLSPAVVLMAHSIRDAIADGLRYYEFLRGDEAYKSRWAKEARKTATLLVAGCFTAREYLRIAGIKDHLKVILGRAAVPKPAPMDSLESPA